MLRLLGRSALFGLAVTACQTKSQGGPASTSSSAAISSVRVVPPRPAPSAEKTEVSLCRVIAVHALALAPDAGTTGAPAVGSALEGRDWLDVGKNTEIVLRHAMTTRELALRGPGRFVPCFFGTETVLVASGSVKTTQGAGARAGAEVILATPFATLHFADAELEVRVSERELETKVTTGVATLVPATLSPASPDAGSSDVFLGPRSKKKLSGAVNAKALVARCSQASSLLEVAPPPVSPGVPSSRALLGEWSVAQLKGRQAARWACAAARASAGRAEGEERSRLWAEIAASDRVWQAAP